MQACLFEDTDSLRRLRLAAVAGRERSAGRFRGRSGSGLPHAGKSHPSLPPAPKLDALALPLAGPGKGGEGRGEGRGLPTARPSTRLFLPRLLRSNRLITAPDRLPTCFCSGVLGSKKR